MHASWYYGIIMEGVFGMNNKKQLYLNIKAKRPIQALTYIDLAKFYLTPCLPNLNRTKSLLDLRIPWDFGKNQEGKMKKILGQTKGQNPSETLGFFTVLLSKFINELKKYPYF